MADDLTKRGKADRICVNVNEPHEVRYWTKRFKCTAAELRKAVDEAGVMVKDVEVALSLRGGGVPDGI